MSPGKELLKVAALKNNWVVKVALTGIEVSQVRLKQKVKVRLNTLGTVEGIINKIPAISNTEGNLFMIDVLLPKLLLTSGVVAGQIAEVIIDFTSENFVYHLPINALMAVDEEGKALVTVRTDTSNGDDFTQQAFDIYKLDNQFVYLNANDMDPPIEIITNGWQHLSINE